MFWTRIERPRDRQRSLRVGGLVIDLKQQRAALDGALLDLSPLLLRLLTCLAGRPGDLVTRADLKRTLWPYAARIDTERRLNTAVRGLRAALGDEAETPRYVETVRGCGYRWVAAI